MRGIVAATLLVLGASVGVAESVDHGNLDEGRPLRLEDAYPIAHGEISVETAAGFTLLKRGPNRGFFPVEILYGALPNLQLGLGSVLFTDPHAIDDRPKAGDLRTSALYNFNQETLRLPALAAKLSLTAPTGIDAHGYGIGLRGIVTKSIELWPDSLFHGYGGIHTTGTNNSLRDGDLPGGRDCPCSDSP